MAGRLLLLLLLILNRRRRKIRVSNAAAEDDKYKDNKIIIPMKIVHEFVFIGDFHTAPRIYIYKITHDSRYCVVRATIINDSAPPGRMPYCVEKSASEAKQY